MTEEQLDQWLIDYTINELVLSKLQSASLVGLGVKAYINELKELGYTYDHANTMSRESILRCIKSNNLFPVYSTAFSIVNRGCIHDRWLVSELLRQGLRLSPLESKILFND